MHLSRHAGIKAPPSPLTKTKAACNIQRHCCSAPVDELFGQILSCIVQFGENPLKKRQKAFYGECAATSSLKSTGWTYLGYLRSSEVDDLPKLFGMEDRLHSLLQNERQGQQLVSWLT